MKRFLNKEILIIPFLFFLVIFVFRQFIFNNLVPIPVNFMAFWYEPFKSQIWPGYLLGIPHKAVGADIFRNLYPLKKLAMSFLTSGQWPLWNPYIFSGTPLLANFQTSVFYPFNLFYFFLPFLDAWTIIILFQPFLAGVFMYLFLRAIKISRLGALFSSSAFAILPFLIVWLEHGIFGHTLIWLPLILFAIEKFLDEISWWSFLLITLGLTMAILAGHPQPLFFVFIVAIAYFLFRLTDPIKLKKEKLSLFILAGLFSLLLGAVQFLPTYELYRLAAVGSTSSEFIFEKFSLPLSQLITFFIPDFFGNIAAYNFWGFIDYTETIGYFGILPLIFGFYALFFSREKKVLFFALLAIVSLSLAFPLPTTKLFISLNLPVISTNVPSRIFFITGFAFIVLAGFGIDEWRRKLKPEISLRRLAKVAIPIGFIYLGAVIFLLLAPLFFACPSTQENCWRVALRNTILPGLTFLVAVGLMILASFKSNWRSRIAIGLIFLHLLSGFYFSNKFLAFSDRRFVFPQIPVFNFLQERAGIDRFFGFNQARIISNLGVNYQLFSPDGYDPLYIKRYGQLIEAANTDGKIKEIVARSDAYLGPGAESDLLKDNLRRERLLALLGVKYILAKNDSSEQVAEGLRFPSIDYQLIWEEEGWKIYQNNKALPRVFLAGRTVAEKDSQTIVDKIFDDTFDLRENVILEERLFDGFWLDEEQVGEATVLDYQPNKIEIETDSLGNNILFLSDVFYPDWNVYLDGRKEKIYRANFVFRAVAIPKGKHRVVFLYEPKAFYLGLKLTVFAAILLIVWLLLIKFKDFKRQK